MKKDVFSILLVDDEKSNIDILYHILKDQYTVYIAKTGQKALARARADKPDLILLDVFMPDMNGFEVLAALKMDDDTRDIPVIFITGLDSAQDEERAFFLGAVDYIRKPFNNAVVKARVKTHMQILRHMRTIEHIGMIDALTDIPNRRSFDSQIDIEWRRAMRLQQCLSILMLDVDKFKGYNDTYGHPQGDLLLQQLARVMEHMLRRSGDVVARIGGEEFAVILANTNYAEAMGIAERLRQNVEKMVVPRQEDGGETRTTVSIGVASRVPEKGDDYTGFMNAADKALYAAKRAGRNRVCGVEGKDA